jgi:hypothetical protein
VTDRTSQPQIMSKLGKPFALSDIRVIRLAQCKRSVVVTGDGETGMQPSHASFGTNLSAIAAGAGIPRSYQLNSLDGVPELVHAIECRTETIFCQVLAEVDEPPHALPPRDGTYLRQRFRASLDLKPFYRASCGSAFAA